MRDYIVNVSSENQFHEPFSVTLHALCCAARTGHVSRKGQLMKLVVFNEGRPGLLTERGVVDVSKLVAPLGGQDGMRSLIERYDELKPELERLAASGTALPLSSVKLKAPIPRAKVLAMGGNYREFGAREPSPMWGFLKSTDGICGDGDTVILPEVDANIFH